MATLFEQYEQAAAQSTRFFPGSRPSYPEITPTGLISVKSQEEPPMFIKHKLDIKPQSSITHLVISNHQLVIALRNKLIVKIDVRQPGSLEDIEFGRSLGDKNASSQIHQIYLDPLGRHLIISVINSDTQRPVDNYYLPSNTRKALVASKTRGNIISAIGWNYLNKNENTTGSILVGTTKGFLFEACFANKGGPDQIWRQVFHLDQESPAPITAIELHKMNDLLQESRYFIFVTTPSRLYQFIGYIPNNADPPMLYHVFKNYEDVPERCVDFPESLPYSCLQFYYPIPRDTLKCFGWMIGPGIYYGHIDYSGQSGSDNVTTNASLLVYPEDNNQNECKDPLAMVLTEFHALVAYQDRIKAICVLNEQLVFEERFPEMYGPLIGITKDPVRGTILAFQEREVYRYEVVKESRNVWEVYLEKGEYEKAKQYCKDNPVNLNRVLATQAEDFFKKKEYTRSASLYAETQLPFEEIALKFLKAGEEDALKEFLQCKLKRLKPQDKTQITMIVMWMLEIYLSQLGSLRNANLQDTEKYATLERKFQDLLKEPRVKQCISNNRRAAYELISSHGDEKNLIHFTDLMKDFQHVIQYYLQHKNYMDVLKVLKRQGQPELFYQYSPILIQAIPRELVSAWIEQGHRLNPAELIPALSLHSEEAIRYLSYCIEKLGNRDMAIHNYLLSLYADYDHGRLMAYLEQQGQDEASVAYDLKYALRLCSERENLERACVHIYSTMRLYEEAVDLALKVDVELAKTNANCPEDNDELKKKLWLKIAKHIVQEENDIKKAMEFLKECKLVKIEDILPFFQDFVTIDHFKDAICSSLQEYNHHIEGLKEEMKDATESAREIREEIQAFRNKYAIVKSESKCAICSGQVLTRAFYVFPCQHMFHTDCLIDEVRPNLQPGKQSRVDDIQRQLVAISGRDDVVSLSSVTGVPSLSHKEKLLAELDDLVASECLYCGEIMIRSVDSPFIDPDEYGLVMQGWD